MKIEIFINVYHALVVLWLCCLITRLAVSDVSNRTSCVSACIERGGIVEICWLWWIGWMQNFNLRGQLSDCNRTSCVSCSGYAASSRV
jgi:hypothetical protein